jgi:hypothetical protein
LTKVTLLFLPVALALSFLAHHVRSATKAYNVIFTHHAATKALVSKLQLCEPCGVLEREDDQDKYNNVVGGERKRR